MHAVWTLEVLVAWFPCSQCEDEGEIINWLKLVNDMIDQKWVVQNKFKWLRLEIHNEERKLQDKYVKSSKYRTM